MSMQIKSAIRLIDYAEKIQINFSQLKANPTI